MIKVMKIKTYDGVIHNNEKDAYRHLDKKYGDIIGHLARNLVQMKYTEAMDFIDNHLAEFGALAVIKNDMILEKNEEEEE